MSIELINVSKSFSDFNLKNISFKVETGEYFALLGRSGAGKSLILELISGFKKVDSGKILVHGKDITYKKIQDREIAFVFQDLAIFPHKTVRQNIEFPLYKKKKHERAQIVEAAAKNMNISHLLDKKPETLSGGELQRTAIARTLVSKPKILLLDEPLSALDIQLKAEATEMLKGLSKMGITIIHITHDYNEALNLADRTAIINKGKIIQQGTIKDVFSKPNSKFAANFAGIDNFYPAVLENDPKANTKNAIIDEKITIKILTPESQGKGFVLIRNQDIILMPEYNKTSAQNNFKGKVLSILNEKQGKKVTIDIGIKISAIITESSEKKLNIKENCDIWVSFKASAVQFIKN